MCASAVPQAFSRRSLEYLLANIRMDFAPLYPCCSYLYWANRLVITWTVFVPISFAHFYLSMLLAFPFQLCFVFVGHHDRTTKSTISYHRYKPSATTMCFNMATIPRSPPTGHPLSGCPAEVLFAHCSNISTHFVQLYEISTA